MKKFICLLITFLFLLLVTSCGKTIKMNGSVQMTLPGEWLDVITIKDKSLIPSRTFSFDGSFNVYETSSLLGYVFTKNDNYLLSEAFSKHLKEVVGDNYIIIKSEVQNYDEKGALFGKERLSLDEGTTSKEYAIVSWDEQGNRYSYIYRMFIHGGKEYYAYTYNTGITMSMEVPLLCQVVGGKQQVYMLNLPYDTVYHLNTNTKIKSLRNKSDYTEASYHTFDYPLYLSGSENKEAQVKDWYIKYCDGKDIDGKFTFSYLGINYQVTFSETNFKIDVIE